jgi:hypothetical protein
VDVSYSAGRSKVQLNPSYDILTPKATKEVGYYDDLQELHRDFQRGLIPSETYERIADRLIERRFLGDDTKQLPR